MEESIKTYYAGGYKIVSFDTPDGRLYITGTVDGIAMALAPAIGVSQMSAVGLPDTPITCSEDNPCPEK